MGLSDKRWLDAAAEPVESGKTKASRHQGRDDVGVMHVLYVAGKHQMFRLYIVDDMRGVLLPSGRRSISGHKMNPASCSSRKLFVLRFSICCESDSRNSHSVVAVQRLSAPIIRHEDDAFQPIASILAAGRGEIYKTSERQEVGWRALAGGHRAVHRR